MQLKWGLRSQADLFHFKLNVFYFSVWRTVIPFSHLFLFSQSLCCLLPYHSLWSDNWGIKFFRSPFFDLQMYLVHRAKLCGICIFLFFRFYCNDTSTLHQLQAQIGGPLALAHANLQGAQHFHRRSLCFCYQNAHALSHRLLPWWCVLFEPFNISSTPNTSCFFREE